jgi:hypothetical protein
MDLVEVLNRIGYTELRDAGTHFRARPLYRDSNNNTSLSIDKRTGQFVDFGGRISGGLDKLVQITLSLPTMEKAKDFLGGDLPDLVVKDNVSLSHIKKFDKGMLVKLVRDHEYWMNRGISPSVIESFKGGLAVNGRMKGRYVFPIFDEREELIGFSGRMTQDNPNYPKWKILGAKKNFLYPSFTKDIIQSRQVILTESIGDAISLVEIGIKNVLVMFGVTISSGILCFLLKSSVEKIFIFLNNDAGNNDVGNEASIELKNTLHSHFDEQQVKIVTPPLKDINIMLLEDKQNLIEFCKTNLC